MKYITSVPCLNIVALSIPLRRGARLHTALSHTSPSRNCVAMVGMTLHARPARKINDSPRSWNTASTEKGRTVAINLRIPNKWLLSPPFSSSRAKIPNPNTRKIILNLILLEDPSSDSKASPQFPDRFGSIGFPPTAVSFDPRPPRYRQVIDNDIVFEKDRCSSNHLPSSTTRKRRIEYIRSNRDHRFPFSRG